MSYILEALKKADRERAAGHVPDLETVRRYCRVNAVEERLLTSPRVLEGVAEPACPGRRLPNARRVAGRDCSRPAP